MQPKIAVALGSKKKDSDQEYCDAITDAGGEVIVLRPSEPTNTENFDGLLLCGGEDIGPELFGEKKELFCDEVDRERDEFELGLLEDFLEGKKPVLAICRGIQTLNVAFGGTLYQDLQQQFPQDVDVSHKNQDGLTREEKRAFRHQARLSPGSRLQQLFGSEIEVNSRHHQAVKYVASGLTVTAVSPDGVIEGVESTQHPWVVGVQWHPEAREVHVNFVPLFESFVSKCNAPRACHPEVASAAEGSEFHCRD